MENLKENKDGKNELYEDGKNELYEDGKNELYEDGKNELYEDGKNESYEKVSRDLGLEGMQDDLKSSTSSEETEYDFTPADVDEVVAIEDDIDMPAGTVRMWVIAIALASLLGGVDAFFLFRFPSISVGAIVAQLLAYPLGNLWHMVVPNWTIGYGKYRVPLNPGPFNQKEHSLIYMFTNSVTSLRLVNVATTEQIKFFNVDFSVGKALVLNISAFFIGWAWCGLALPILVYPSEMVWPSILSGCALMKTLHSRENPYVPNWKISRMSYFAIIFIGGFVWYFFSDFIIPFIAKIGAFITWIVPNNAIVGQVFGTKNGLSLLPISFDWTTILNLSNPLTVPFVHAATVFLSFVFWVWCVIPGLYYKNHWQVGHFPILSNTIYNVNGTSYDATKVVNSKFELDYEKYAKYSPVFIPVGFLMQIALTLAAFSSMIVTIMFRFKKDVINPLRNPTSDIHSDLMLKYKKFPTYIYPISLLIGIALGVMYVAIWKDIAQISVGGYFVSIILGAILYLPMCMVEAQSTLVINLQAFMNLVSAFWFPGKPLAVLYFTYVGFATLQHSEHLCQGAKMGHYLKVPPRVTMVVLFAAGMWGSLVNCGVTIFFIHRIKDVCSLHAPNNMTCKFQRTSFNQHLVWGLFGDHIFAKGGRYSFILWFFLVGAVMAVILNVIQRIRPQAKFLKYLNPTLLVSGASQIPNSTGINYATWFSVIVVFNYFIHKYNNAWWRKYNLVTAVGLDCGIAIAAIIVFFCITYTGASKHYHWWGTTVGLTGCDAKGCPYLPKDTIRNPGKW
ncbi:uncharacterized protein KQ657_001717 [Scheffersomyces spartinae]|uniref:Oligopeptide transporter n=1 Tax=Scheffersomyces spartinae TaxID=45513 RepID=A0A9P7V7F7_9ASCO|nr:uncharacterized protein KQ657_001717 [Scheffersomyces spartinae]KAG7192616.1 hypothetical protein KQ657_001717 [Scheffersomyces spartinae]